MKMQMMGRQDNHTIRQPVDWATLPADQPRPRHARFYCALKPLVDRLVTLGLLPILLPSMAIVWLLVRMIDGPDVLIGQTRLGLGGQPFKMYKFRTMRGLNEGPLIDAFHSAMTRHGDRRVTRLGRVLRRFRLDELPQFVNVLRGEMSWVGPRPEMLVLGRHYEREIPNYRARYGTLPGITGLAQVCQGHVIDDAAIGRKLALDLQYIRQVSVWFDLWIALRTLPVIVLGRGAR